LVEETSVPSGWQYVSRWYHLAPDGAPDWHCLSLAPDVAEDGRAAMMLRAEGDQWGVVLLAPEGQPLPADDGAFLAFTDRLGDGELRRVLDRAAAASPIHRYGATSSRIRHFERVAAWPEGLVALGDTVCALDPYYGLGMTASARAAVLLRTLLAEEGAEPTVGKRFQEELATLNAWPWGLVTGQDVDGGPLPGDGKRLREIYRAAPSDTSIAHALLAVQHRLRPPEPLQELQPT